MLHPRAMNVETLLISIGPGGGAIAVSLLIAAPSMGMTLAGLGAMGFAVFSLVTRQVRRPLLAALFFLAPPGTSEALIAPPVGSYHAADPYFSPELHLLLAHVALLALLVVWLERRCAPLQLPGSRGLTSGIAVNFGGEATTVKPTGFMSHPNALAHDLTVMLLPASAPRLMGPGRLPPHIWQLSLIMTVGMGLALLATLSRGGWGSAVLAFSLVTAVYLRRGPVTRQQLGFAALALALGAIALVTLSPTVLPRLTASDNCSLESRVLLADMAFTIIKANPLAGIGFGGFNRAAYEYCAPLYAMVSPDHQLALHQLVVQNHFLLVAAELGTPAMLLLALHAPTLAAGALARPSGVRHRDRSCRSRCRGSILLQFRQLLRRHSHLSVLARSRRAAGAHAADP
jgi:hypothetical protein